MNMKKIWTHLLALSMAVLMGVSILGSSAQAVNTAGLEEAKSSLAEVKITQNCDGSSQDYITHDCDKGSNVEISYEASLRMTDIMANYLQPRQKNLKYAFFNVHIHMDMDKLVFSDASDKVTATFQSTFLKPSLDGCPDYHVMGCKDLGIQVSGPQRNGDYFSYDLTIDKSKWQSDMVIPMELIVYVDGNGTAYGPNDVRGFAGKDLFYKDFTLKRWMSPITLRIANMSVKPEVVAKVTATESQYVVAKGTVDGVFSYAFDADGKVGGFSRNGNELYFGPTEIGHDPLTDEWQSNEVIVELYRGQPKNPPIIVERPDSPLLNLEDHFAYIIGFNDGKVHPEGNITRAEVATIFFRMLTDDVRTAYWKTTNPYNDVAADAWYNNAISTLTNLNIIKGFNDGGFHPQANITRAEFATMAVRFFTVNSEIGQTQIFNDVSGHWAEKNINIAYLIGIIKGYEDGSFRPDKAITRAEAMSIVNNTLRRTPCKMGLLANMITWPDNMDTNKWYYATVQEATNSHAYVYFENDEVHGDHYKDASCEQWTELLPVRDWAALERSWSNAGSSANPGEVVQ